jgi:hypothetical protein
VLSILRGKERFHMPTPGLSLVGFMDQQQAISYFQKSCFPRQPNASISADWGAAQANLGSAFPNAGSPDIQPFPGVGLAYEQQMVADPWTAAVLNSMPGYALQFVEIDPLLAFQFAIDEHRAAQHCAALAGPPNIGELFPICLPIGEPREPFQWSLNPQGTSLVVKSRSLNLRPTNVQMNASQASVQMVFHLGFSAPFIQVVRLNDRCFLFNAYHRAFGIRRAGHTHIPCILRDVGDYESVGVRSDGNTFPPSAFEQATMPPMGMPTMGHFTQGRAHHVLIRAVSRTLTVNWAEHATPDE